MMSQFLMMSASAAPRIINMNSIQTALVGGETLPPWSKISFSSPGSKPLSSAISSSSPSLAAI